MPPQIREGFCFAGEETVKFLYISMEKQRTKNTVDGQFAMLSSHHNDQDVPDGGGPSA